MADDVNAWRYLMPPGVLIAHQAQPPRASDIFEGAESADVESIAKTHG